MFLWVLLEFTDNELLSDIVRNRLEQTGDYFLSEGNSIALKIHNVFKEFNNRAEFK